MKPRASLASVRLAWAELQADAVVDEALTHQFETAIEAVEGSRGGAAAGAGGRRRARPGLLAREQADRLHYRPADRDVGGRRMRRIGSPN